MKTIATHGSNFHTDDLFAVAALLMLYKDEKCRVIRTLDPDVLAKADIVVDIGRIYDPKRNLFDHHQGNGAGERENGIPYAAFGLVWKTFGKKIAGSQVVADYVDKKLAAPLDAHDNGVDVSKPLFKGISQYELVDYIGDECDFEKGKPEEERDLDEAFMRLVPLATRILTIQIERGKQRQKTAKLEKKAYDKAKDKRIVITDAFAPFSFEDFPDVLFYVYRDMRGNWSAKAVKLEPGSMASRQLFPKAWRGKDPEELARLSGVADAIFCHSSGFLVVANSKEGAIALATNAVNSKSSASSKKPKGSPKKISKELPKR